MLKGIEEVSKLKETKELKLLKVQALQEKAKGIVLQGIDIKNFVSLEHFLGFVENFPHLYAAVKKVDSTLSLARESEVIQKTMWLEKGLASSLLSRLNDSFVCEATNSSERWVDEDMKLGNIGIIPRILYFYIWLERASSLGFCKSEYQLRDLAGTQVVYNKRFYFYSYQNLILLVDTIKGVCYSYKHSTRILDVISLYKSCDEVFVEVVTTKGIEKVHIFEGFVTGSWEERGQKLNNNGKKYCDVKLISTKYDMYDKASSIRLHQLVLLSRVGFNGILACRGQKGLLTVDHINMDASYNAACNLRILSRRDNKILGEELSENDNYSVRYIDFDRYFGAEERFSRVSQKELEYEVAMSRILESIA